MADPSTLAPSDPFELLTFDCYGTLIDWESGIADAVGAILEGHGVALSRDSILETHAELEAPAQAAGYRSYRDILARVVDGFGHRYGFTPSAGERASLAASIADWPAFPDAVEALDRLAGQYRLAILSNIDDDLFALSSVRLGVDFAEIVTAEQVRSYKPGRAHFDAVLERLDLDASRVLHVAQSLFHDIAPARELGFTTVWVNRRRGLSGTGATPAAGAEVSPDFEVPDLSSLADRIA